MRWPWGKKALEATPSVLDAIGERGWTPGPMLGGGSSQRIIDAFNTAQSASYSTTYMTSPAVRTVVDVIVRNVGQLDLRLFEEVGPGERQPRPDHPAALSLRYPSEEVTQDQWVRQMFKDYLIYANAYSLLTPAAGGQLVVNWMPAAMVEIRGASLFRAEGYRYWKRDGTYEDFLPEQVMHWRGENPQDPRIGFSMLETLRAVTSEEAAMQQAVVELASSGLSGPTVITRDLEAPEWSQNARRGFEEDITNRLRNANKRAVVFEEGMKPINLGMSATDAQMLESRRWTLERVAAAYGVPAGMVGLSENIAEAHSEFLSDTLPPYCEDFTKMLNQRLLVRAYNWTEGCFEFNLDEKNMGDDRLKTLVSASGRPVLLTDEARAMLNLPPVEGGDELVTPLNVQVGDGPPAPGVMPPPDANAPVAQDGSGRATDNPAQLPAPKSLKAQEYTPLPQFHPGRKADLDRQHANIEVMRKVVEHNFGRLEAALSQKSVSDWNRWDKEFSRDINKALNHIVDKEGSLYAFKFGGSFDMGLTENYLTATAEGAASAINQTVRDNIEQLGKDAAIAYFPQHVASASASLGARATVWAREEAARQSPDTNRRVKTWIADTDRHAEFDGDTVGLDEDWPSGFAPGTAPGCKCTAAIS